MPNEKRFSKGEYELSDVLFHLEVNYWLTKLESQGGSWFNVLLELVMQLVLPGAPCLSLPWLCCFSLLWLHCPPPDLPMVVENIYWHLEPQSLPSPYLSFIWKTNGEGNGSLLQDSCLGNPMD